MSRSLRAWWVRLVALAALGQALAVVAWWPMLAAYPNTQNGDGQAYHEYLEAARVSVARYREFPFWNPYQCGGNPLWDNPQSFAGAPLLWLTFVLGTTRTLEIWILVHVALGFVCMWVFARHELRLGRLSTFVAAGAWAFSGFHQHHGSGGHLTFAPFVFFPLALLLWRRAERDARCAVGLGLLVALMFYEGAVYPLPHLAVLLGAETFTRALPVRRMPAIAAAAGIVGVVSFTVAACRLLPVLDQLRQHRRVMAPDVDALQWTTLKDMFLARAHGRNVPGQQYVWTEYGTYLGPIILLLAGIGMAVGATEAWWMLALTGLTFALMCGHFAAFAPWSLLHGHVPPFQEMRVPSRFRAEVSMFLAAFAGIAVERLPAAMRRWRPQRRWGEAAGMAVGVIALVGVFDIVVVGVHVIGPFFTAPPEQPSVEASERLHDAGPGVGAYIDRPRQNRATSFCYDEWAFGEGMHAWEGDVPQARALDDGAVIEVANRTQNTLTIDVNVTRPSRILLNAAYDDDWKTDVGQTVNEGHQLAVDLPAGHHRVHVRCWPRTFDLGVALTALGIAGSLAFFARDARRRKRTGEDVR